MINYRFNIVFYCDAVLYWCQITNECFTEVGNISNQDCLFMKCSKANSDWVGNEHIVAHIYSGHS